MGEYMNTININEKELEELKVEYNRAISAGYRIFSFKGADLLVDYAKYLIEYLENQFKIQKQSNLN